MLGRGAVDADRDDLRAPRGQRERLRSTSSPRRVVRAVGAGEAQPGRGTSGTSPSTLEQRRGLLHGRDRLHREQVGARRRPAPRSAAGGSRAARGVRDGRSRRCTPSRRRASRRTARPRPRRSQRTPSGRLGRAGRGASRASSTLRRISAGGLVAADARPPRSPRSWPGSSRWSRPARRPGRTRGAPPRSRPGRRAAAAPTRGRRRGRARAAPARWRGRRRGRRRRRRRPCSVGTRRGSAGQARVARMTTAPTSHPAPGDPRPRPHRDPGAHLLVGLPGEPQGVRRGAAPSRRPTARRPSTATSASRSR